MDLKTPGLLFERPELPVVDLAQECWRYVEAVKILAEELHGLVISSWCKETEIGVKLGGGCGSALRWRL
jgi:hypothetical protein